MSVIEQFDNINIVKNEEDIRDFWEHNSIYQKQLEQNAEGPEFNFCDGPPFVSGDLHLGHMLVSSVKSSILNYKAMNGFNVKNKIGFDTHGLPIEQLANKKLTVGKKRYI